MSSRTNAFRRALDTGAPIDSFSMSLISDRLELTISPRPLITSALPVEPVEVDDDSLRSLVVSRSRMVS
jgi:hypothetical protein